MLKPHRILTVPIALRLFLIGRGRGMRQPPLSERMKRNVQELALEAGVNTSRSKGVPQSGVVCFTCADYPKTTNTTRNGFYQNKIQKNIMLNIIYIHPPKKNYEKKCVLNEKKCVILHLEYENVQ